jgi:hypothetical protein
MRKLTVLIVATAVVVGAAWAVQAATTSGTTPISCMDTLWHTAAASTSSTQFANVPGFTDSPTSVFPISIDVSALVSGAPAEFRILSTNQGAQTHASEPGVTRFVPAGGGPDSFSFGWVEQNQSASPHANLLRLQWRSPSGHAVHLLRGDMKVEYATDGCVGP